MSRVAGRGEYPSHRCHAATGSAKRSAPGRRSARCGMTLPHPQHQTAPSAPASVTSGDAVRPRRRHPVTLLWSVPGWRPFLRDTVTELARIGANVVIGVTWTTGRLWWRSYDPLGRESQRLLLAAAVEALQTCVACGADRSWREPTTRMPTSVIGTADGPVRLRLCAACRLEARDAARFLADLEAADAVAAREGL